MNGRSSFDRAKEEELEELADFFSLFADSTRIKILNALDKTPLCASDMENSLGICRTAVVHQLRKLKAARLVRSYKEFRKTMYALDDEHIHHIFNTGLDHIRH